MDEEINEEKFEQMFSQWSVCYQQTLASLVRDALITKLPKVVYVSAYNPFAVLALFHGSLVISVSNISYN